jgi:hypothetical protein
MQEPELPQEPDVADLPALTPEQIAEMTRRARGPGPFYSGDFVIARLRALEQEWERTGGLDAEQLKAFRAKLDEEYPPHYRVSAKPS